jgi:ABC-2 type transport system permease protein
MQVMIDVVWYAVQIALFEVLYLHTDTIAGFTHAQMIVFLGTVFITDAVNMLLFSHNFWHFTDYIRTGEMDFFLVKPVSTFFLAFFRYVNIAALLNLALGVTVLVYGVQRVGLQVDGWSVVVFALLCGCGLAVTVALQVMIAASAVFTVASEGIQYLFYTLHQFATRPDVIYKNYVRRFLLYILPLSLIASVPARALTGGLSVWLVLWSVLAAGGFLLLSFAVFRWSLRHYSGASA